MPDSISVVLKLVDDITSPLKSIASTAKGCSKEFETLQRQTQQLGQRYAALNKEASRTAAEALEVKKEMKEAAKAFKETGDAADKVRLETLTEKYENLTDVTKGYRAAAKETIKEMNSVAQAARRLADENASNAEGSVTSEGNTAVGNDANGGAVMRRQRRLSLVTGACRPGYNM